MTGGLPVVGHLPELARQPLEFLQRVRAHGDVVTVRLGPTKAYVVNKPELLHAVLVRNAKDFDKGIHMEKAAQVIGNSLPVSSGAFYRHQRKLVRPAFRQTRLREYFTIMLECTLATVDTWSPDTDVHREIRKLAGMIAAKALFAALTPEQAAEESIGLIDVIASLLTRRMLDPTGLLEKLPLPSNRRLDKAQRCFRTLAEGFMHDYRRIGVDRHDLLSALLAARDDNSGDGMSDRQVSDEATGFLAAGVEATSQALRWTAHLLGEHPQIQRELCTEVDEVLAGRTITFDDIDKLDFTRRVITESLRLYPPIYVGSRRPIDDIQIGDHLLPAGSMIILCPYALHRDPDLYPDPERFDPDRWLPGGADELPANSYLPFGAGLRSCIGEQFAMIEMITVLTRLAQRWTLSRQPSVTVRPKVAAFILSPSANGVKLEPRHSDAGETR